MARTIRAAAGKCARRRSRRVPARIDRTMLVLAACKPGATVASSCGLTPIRSRSGASSSGTSRTTRTPGATAVPLGRTTVTLAGSRPQSSQRRSIAPAMLPQPISHMRSIFSGRVTPLRAFRPSPQRVLRLRRFAAPQHELEHGVEAVELVHRDLDDRFRLIERQAGITAKQEGMAEQQSATLTPQLEMTEPQLFVDDADGLVKRGTSAGRWRGYRERRGIGGHCHRRATRRAAHIAPRRPGQRRRPLRR